MRSLVHNNAAKSDGFASAWLCRYKVMKIIFVFSLLFLSYICEADIENSYETSLSHVYSGGYWKLGKKDGYLRFITKRYGSEHVTSKLFVQWITYHYDGVSDSKILSEVPIKELNNDYYSFSSPLCQDQPPCQSYLLVATHSFSNKTHEFTLTFPNIGVYTIIEKAL